MVTKLTVSGEPGQAPNPLNEVDPLDLWGLNPVSDLKQGWNDTGGKVVHAIHTRLPDYVSTNLSRPIPGMPFTVSGGTAVTRQGHVYLSGGLGVGFGSGVTANLSASWIGHDKQAPSCQIDSFVHALSVNVSALAPVVEDLDLGLAAGVTWGNVGQYNTGAVAKDLGIGAGPAGPSGAITYSGRIPVDLPGW